MQAQQRAGAGLKAREVKKIKRRVVKKAFYSDEEDESQEEEFEVNLPTSAEVGSGQSVSVGGARERLVWDEGGRKG